MSQHRPCLQRHAVLVAAVALGVSCSGGNDTGIPDDCNPLAGGSCMLPWPSSVYLEPDDATATGFRVAVPPGAMPVNIDLRPVDPTPWNRADGFSPNAVIVVGFPGGVSPVGLPGPDDIAASTAASSPIVLLDMDAGKRVPFFAEVDATVADPTRRALLIRPLARMAPGSRHAVAVRKSVRAADGSPLPAPAAFQAVLDGRSFGHPLMARLEPGYPAIFAALERDGVPRTDLALAWDFVTASDEYLTSDLMAMRDQALPLLHDDGAELTFEGEVVPGRGDPAKVYRFITGTYDSPMFLSDGESDASVLVRDAAGRPLLQGTYRARFAAIIPACVATTRPLRVVLFGHGLFGNGADALADGFLQQVAQDNCAVMVAGDWIGLTNRNITTAALAMNDLNRGPALVEKLPQAVVNFMALARIARGPFARSELFTYESSPVISDDEVVYYGASLGGIMGNLFMAYYPDITRGALGVPGGNWSLMFERSLAWPPLRIAMGGAYPDPLLDANIVALLGAALDPYDPITTAPRVVADPLPGTPAKQLFLYQAVGDSLVANLATEMVARAMRIQVTGPSLRVPYGLEAATGAITSGLTIYDEHPSPMPPASNVSPAEDNGTHVDVNMRPAVQRQVARFLADGVLENECAVDEAPAPCDCATGACD